MCLNSVKTVSKSILKMYLEDKDSTLKIVIDIKCYISEMLLFAYAAINIPFYPTNKTFHKKIFQAQ